MVNFQNMSPKFCSKTDSLMSIIRQFGSEEQMHAWPCFANGIVKQRTSVGKLRLPLSKSGRDKESIE